MHHVDCPLHDACTELLQGWGIISGVSHSGVGRWVYRRKSPFSMEIFRVVSLSVLRRACWLVQGGVFLRALSPAATAALKMIKLLIFEPIAWSAVFGYMIWSLIFLSMN